MRVRCENIWLFVCLSVSCCLPIYQSLTVIHARGVTYLSYPFRFAVKFKRAGGGSGGNGNGDSGSSRERTTKRGVCTE